jgi:hypothetical protein
MRTCTVHILSASCLDRAFRLRRSPKWHHISCGPWSKGSALGEIGCHLGRHSRRKWLIVIHALRTWIWKSPTVIRFGFYAYMVSSTKKKSHFCCLLVVLILMRHHLQLSIETERYIYIRFLQSVFAASWEPMKSDPLPLAKVAPVFPFVWGKISNGRVKKKEE